MAAGAPLPQPPPPHKLIPGCGFLVDGFKYAAHPCAEAFFLSHAHSDHYTGLKDDWSRGPIYCSEVTARLVAHMLGVGREWLVVLPMDSTVVIKGVDVTAVTANHCPGAVQFLFRLPDGRRYVHTGDMRYCPSLQDNPHLQQFRGCDALYLDTTYCDPKHCFPLQEESIEYVAGTIQRLLQEDTAQHQEEQEQGSEEEQEEGQQAGLPAQSRRPFRRLYLICTYGIGKERILTAVHDRCGVQLHVADRKHAVMQQLELPGYDPAELFTTDRTATPVHVVQWGYLGDTWPFFQPNFVNPEQLRQELGAEEVVGFVPTGWLYEMKKETFSVRSKGACSVHLVPYSEHSSFAELQDYVRFLRPHKVVPTVGVEGKDGEKARDKMLKHFRRLVDETASKANFLSSMFKASSTEGSKLPDAMPDDEPQQDCKQGRDLGAQQQQQQQQDCEVVDLAGEEEEQNGGRGAGSGGSEQVAAAQEGALQPTAATARAATAGQPGAAAAAAAAMGLSVPPSSVPHAAISCQPEEAAGPSEPLLQQLLAVLGEGVSKQQGRQLLAAANDDLRGAVNGYFEAQATAAGAAGGAARRTGSSAGKAATASPASPAPRSGVAGGLSGSKASVAGTPSGTPGTKRAAATPASKAKGSGGKKQKVQLSPGQRPITTFFAKPATQQEQEQERQGEQKPDQHQRRGAQQQPDQQQQRRQQQQQGPSGRVPRAADAAGHAGGPGAAAEGDVAVTPSGTSAQLSGAAQNTGRPVLAERGMSPPASPPPPPLPSLPASPPAKGGLALYGGSGGGGGGTARESAVPRDAVTLPLSNYDPVAHACWEAGQAAPYLHLARAFEAMHSTKKRLRISDVLVNCFRSVLALCPPEQLVECAYLATGRIAPDYEGIELQVGGSVMTAAIVEATGVSRNKLHGLYRDLGDVGDVFQACKQNQSVLVRPTPLTIPGVFATLHQIAGEKGGGSQKRRQRAVLSLLRACRESEPKFIARTLVQNLRVGANWRSVIPALARAVVLHKEGPKAVKAHLDQAAAAATAAFHVCPSLQLLTDAMLAHPTEDWQQRCSLTPGMPIKPMLAKICEGLDDALEQLKGGPFLAEWKYDGMRAQIHMLPDGGVRIFSRNCEDQLGRFPDAAQQILEAAQGGATSAIFDTELVAVDRSEGNRLRAFQELATRKKVGVELESVSVHVCIFAFDLLYLNGSSLLHLPLEQRRRQLAEALPNMQPGRCALAHSVQFLGAPGSAAADAPSVAAAGPVSQQEASGGSSERSSSGVDGASAGVAALGGAAAQQQQQQQQQDEPAGAGVGVEAAPLEEQLQECLLSAFAAGTEGLMLKSLHTAYEPSKRSDHWYKLKRDYCEGLHDTLDLVVIGAWWGNGRKAGWYSPFLLACYDPDTGDLQSVCRCMSGFTDAFYRDAKERLDQTIIPGPKPYCRTGERPDVWFEPEEVWEIRGADLSLSPVHKAAQGRVHGERGLGLRFPRFLRRREDKSLEDATSAEQLADMFNAQTRKVESAGHRLAAGKQQQRAVEAAEVSGDEHDEEAATSDEDEQQQQQPMDWLEDQ